MKRIIIGGSGSTGSSLLNNVLGRNANIISTIETSVFCKKELFENFQLNKWRIPYRFPLGLSNYGYHLYRKTDCNFMGILKEEKLLLKIIRQSNHFQEFVDLFFEAHKNYNGQQTWVEKTPANSFLFKEFLSGFENSYVIHSVRNPLDALTSLLERGYSDIYAGGIYLLNALTGKKASNFNRYLEVNYDHFTQHSEETAASIFNFIGEKFYGYELEPGKTSTDRTDIASWTKSELDKIEPNVGRFIKASKITQKRVLGIINHLKISEKGARYYNVEALTFKKFINQYFPKIKIPTSAKDASMLKKQIAQDKNYRLKKAYWNHYLHYPLEITND